MAKKKTEKKEEVLSPEKEAFMELIENYKENSPEKYELKKEELEAKLNSL